MMVGRMHRTSLALGPLVSVPSVANPEIFVPDSVTAWPFGDLGAKLAGPCLFGCLGVCPSPLRAMLWCERPLVALSLRLECETTCLRS